MTDVRERMAEAIANWTCLWMPHGFREWMLEARMEQGIGWYEGIEEGIEKDFRDLADVCLAVMAPLPTAEAST